MPQANPMQIPSNQVGRYPGNLPGATPKPKLRGRFPKFLRSRHYHYHHILDRAIGDLEEVIRARKAPPSPVLMTR